MVFSVLGTLRLVARIRTPEVIDEIGRDDAGLEHVDAETAYEGDAQGQQEGGLHLAVTVERLSKQIAGDACDSVEVVVDEDAAGEVLVEISQSVEAETGGCPHRCQSDYVPCVLFVGEVFVLELDVLFNSGLSIGLLLLGILSFFFGRLALKLCGVGYGPVLFSDELEVLVGAVSHSVDLVEVGRSFQRLSRVGVAFLVEVEHRRFRYHKDNVDRAQDAQREELDGYYAVVLSDKLELGSEEDDHSGTPEQFEEDDQLLASGMDVLYDVHEVHDGPSSEGCAGKEEEHIEGHQV